jgi:pSer/pThr/pTyr-binding forkhead associated (FHA) protein
MTDAGEAVVTWTPERGSQRRCAFHGRCEIGRSPRSRILLVGPGVSRRHAVLELSASGLTVQNVSSANAISVNGAPLDPGESSGLRPGDVLAIAGVRIRVEAVRAPVSAAPSHIVCTRSDCRREVPADLADCPWCGTSMAFAHTSLGRS